MASLYETNLWRGESSKVFFADGKWGLVEVKGPVAFIDGWSGIAHKCGWFGSEKVTRPSKTYGQVHPLCANCNDEVPTELVGLWKMHNWDNIQEVENQSAMYKQHHGFYLHGTRKPTPR